MNINNNNKTWDTIIIGGGPAGMMAAGRAAELDKSVLLLEKNLSLGKKLLITGGGRCNLTNNKTDMKFFISQFKDRPKVLFSILSQFGITDVINFFASYNMPTKIENEDRVFPTSDNSQSVLKVLLTYMKEGGVVIKVNSSVLNISIDKLSNLVIVKTKNNKYITKSCIIATGGVSYVKTGSTGDGFKWLKKLGHTIIKNNYSLVPIVLHNDWVKNLAGSTIQGVKISIIQNNKKIESKIGKILFTHVGISGPTILNMSSKIRELLENDEVIVEIDLLPNLDYGELKLKFQDMLMQESNKKIKNTLSALIPSALVLVILNLSKIDSNKPNHSVTKKDRSTLLHLIKAIPLNIKELLGADKAIVSSGGIRVEEINFKTMESKIVSNVFIVGDLLNIDRPSGGYSLQICWSSGFVAGENCG